MSSESNKQGPVKDPKQLTRLLKQFALEQTKFTSLVPQDSSASRVQGSKAEDEKGQPVEARISQGAKPGQRGPRMSVDLGHGLIFQPLAAGSKPLDLATLSKTHTAADRQSRAIGLQKQLEGKARSKMARELAEFIKPTDTKLLTPVYEDPKLESSSSSSGSTKNIVQSSQKPQPNTIQTLDLVTEPNGNEIKEKIIKPIVKGTQKHTKTISITNGSRSASNDSNQGDKNSKKISNKPNKIEDNTSKKIPKKDGDQLGTSQISFGDFSKTRGTTIKTQNQEKLYQNTNKIVRSVKNFEAPHSESRIESPGKFSQPIGKLLQRSNIGSVQINSPKRHPRSQSITDFDNPSTIEKPNTSKRMTDRGDPRTQTGYDFRLKASRDTSIQRVVKIAPIGQTDLKAKGQKRAPEEKSTDSAAQGQRLDTSAAYSAGVSVSIDGNCAAAGGFGSPDLSDDKAPPAGPATPRSRSIGSRAEGRDAGLLSRSMPPQPGAEAPRIEEHAEAGRPQPRSALRPRDRPRGPLYMPTGLVRPRRPPATVGVVHGPLFPREASADPSDNARRPPTARLGSDPFRSKPLLSLGDPRSPVPSLSEAEYQTRTAQVRPHLLDLEREIRKDMFADQPQKDNLEIRLSSWSAEKKPSSRRYQEGRGGVTPKQARGEDQEYRAMCQLKYLLESAAQQHPLMGKYLAEAVHSRHADLAALAATVLLQGNAGRGLPSLLRGDRGKALHRSLPLHRAPFADRRPEADSPGPQSPGPRRPSTAYRGYLASLTAPRLEVPCSPLVASQRRPPVDAMVRRVKDAAVHSRHGSRLDHHEAADILAGLAVKDARQTGSISASRQLSADKVIRQRGTFASALSNLLRTPK